MKTSEIASILGGELSGDPDIEIGGLSSFSEVSPNHLTFLTKCDPATDYSRIPAKACVLVPLDADLPKNVTAIKVQNPKHAFAVIARDLTQTERPDGIRDGFEAGDGAVIEARFIGRNVSVGSGTRVGEGAELYDGVSIGNDVSIGARTVIYPNAVIYDGCRIGDDCILHAGAVIGAEGFGYVREDDDIAKFPQIGTVIIENNVEIGANSCVDRGALGETRIGSHTKIDNLVQIAHNVSIGQRVLIAAHVGISGSVVIEDDVVIGGQAGIADHVTIKKGAILGARSAVFPGKIVRAGIWAGSPVQPIEKYKEQNALIRSLARLRKEIYEIKDRLG